MDTDDLEPEKKKPAPKNLEVMSIEALEDYIADLESEISRVREAIAGKDLPYLTYMLTFKDMEEREANWKTFIDHPEWKKLSAMTEFKDTVSKIHRTFLEPLGISQI